ncbi:MAG TPA: redoxin family protein, partial [Pirellulales bacterium]
TQPAAAGVLLGFGDSLHPLGRRLRRIMDQTLRRAPRLSLSGILVVGCLATVVLPGLRQSDGDDSAPPVKQPEPAAVEVADEKGEPTVATEWPEGATVSGRVVDHQGRPVANAEVLLLGAERVFVDADRRNWFVPGKQDQRPASTRTDKDGAFSITRKLGTSDRLGVIADDPLFWVVSRKNLPRSGPVEIKLPASGSLAIDCDLPNKPNKVPVIIQSKTFDHAAWDADSLRFHMSSFSLDNPGKKLFKGLPPGQFAAQIYHKTKTADGTHLMDADRQLVEIESAKQAQIRFERKAGRSLLGVVRGLEDAKLRDAYLGINCLGPEEVLHNDGKHSRMMIGFDAIPITSDGRFTIDPIPPGQYWAYLYAVLEATPRLSPQQSDFSFLTVATFTVPEEGELPKVELIAKANAAPDLSKVTDLRVRVVDEDGKPLPNAQVMLHTADQGYKRWASGGDGLVFLGGDFEFRDAALQLLVRADGYASTIVHFPRAQREKLTTGEATIALRRGRKVQLRFNPPKGLTWPKGTVPETYFDDLQTRVRIMWQPSNRRNHAPDDFNLMNLKDVGAGRFEFQLAEDTPRFYVAVHAPGFLQFFETGPFTFADVKNDGINIDLPRPATLDISFAPGDYPDAASLFKNASLDVLWQIQGNSYLNVASVADGSLTPRLKLTDLAPGHYLADVRTQPRDDSKPLAGTQVNLGRYHDRRMSALKDGQVEKIDFRSSPYDLDAFRGTRTAVLRITTADGKPAQGREVSVTRYDGHYGSQVVFSGAVPESGEIMLAGISDAKSSDAHAPPPYQVRMGDQYLGSFGFAQEAAAERFEFSLPPGAGDMAPDVKLTNLATGERISLSDLRGKVVFVELWATWCGPCQRPMAALNALGNEQRETWKDSVVIVPISIDAERARVRSHVREREWTAVEQFSSDGGEGADFESPAARAFVLSSVPQSVLIGRDGRILWRGHPTNQTDGLDVKSRIERALK